MSNFIEFGNTDLESNKKSSWPWKSIALNELILNHQEGPFFATLRDSIATEKRIFPLFAKEAINIFSELQNHSTFKFSLC